MKTAYANILFSVSLLLMIVLATGCQPEDKVVVSGDVATDEVVDQQNPVGQDQASVDQVKPADETDPSATENVEGDSDSGDQSSAIAGSSDLEDSQSSMFSPSGQADENYEAQQEDDTPAEPTIDIPATWKRLGDKQEVWIDTKNKQVIVGGKVCLSEGPLEMLICPRNTKEHEAVVAVNAQSWQVHAGLIAIGATPGVPCRWVPEYTSAWGPKIDIKMMWRDEKTKKIKTIDGKQWILNSDTQKPMTTELVFGGSYSEPEFEGEQARYQADDGELICLANFSTSTIDLRVSEKDINILFEANTPLIPPINTQVYTVIIPGPVIGKPEE